MSANDDDSRVEPGHYRTDQPCHDCGGTLWREPDIYTTFEAWQDAVREFNREHEHHAKLSKAKEHEPWSRKSL